MPAEAESLREVVRGYVSGGTGARHLEKYARETRMPAVTRMRLERLYGVTYREVRGHDT